MAIKPILFNTEMVRAILDGRKTQTRRIAKALYFTGKRCDGLTPSEFCFFISPKTGLVYWKDIERMVLSDGKPVRAPYMPGDIMWARESFDDVAMGRPWYYRADGDIRPDYWKGEKWLPSIHMPKEAARIFLRVKDVHVERLQSIQRMDAKEEGVGTLYLDEIIYSGKEYGCMSMENGTEVEQFAWLWESTIKKADLPSCGWAANPWVWVIEFERCQKPEGWC